MSGSGATTENGVRLRQPTPTFGSSHSPHAPNVEWLEQSAETMSNHSLRSQTRRRHSQRSSLGSASHNNSTYAAAMSMQNQYIAEYDEPPYWYNTATQGGQIPQYFESKDYGDFHHHIASSHSRHTSDPQSYYPDHHSQSQEQWRSPRTSMNEANGQHHMQSHMSPGRHYPVSVSRGPSVTTTSTGVREGSLFRDFDGTHYIPVPSAASENNGVVQKERPGNKEAAESRTSNDDSMIQQLRLAYDEAVREAEAQQGQETAEGEEGAERIDIMPSQAQNFQHVAPPPEENMVYYPAPVPTKLNRPERISKVPQQDINARKRAQILASVPYPARKSALWLPNLPGQEEGSERDDKVASEGDVQPKQRQNVSKLPPQLRASVFFDQQSVPHSVQIKDGSAVATLDSLLDASAKAPPNASVEDTIKAAAENLKHKRIKSESSSLLLGVKEDARRSLASLLPFKKAGTERQSQTGGRASSASQLGAYSQAPSMKEADDYDEEGVYVNEETPLADRSSVGSHDVDEEDHDGQDRSRESDNEQLEDSLEPGSGEEIFAVAPSTLLAELQLRKQQLRSRNRTAATAFPNGMHSTLLELDAVAQIEKKKRQGQRTTLAWEDPDAVAAAEEELRDDDVPLALLYPTKCGLINKAGAASQVGLLAKRDMEESEPLSKRRNRLKGINLQTPRASKPNTTAGDDDSDNEGETLAQRTRRLKLAKTLNDAIEGAGGDQAGDTFTNDVMSRFGGPDKALKSAEQDVGEKSQDSPVEEETLGQRRKRLQAEAKRAQGGIESLRQRGSLSNLLVESPAGANPQASNEAATAGLVGQSEQSRQQRRNHLSQQNFLSSSNLLQAPLINANRFATGQRRVSGLLEANAQTLESRRQRIQDTNERSATVGIDAPLIEQQLKGTQRSHLGMATSSGPPQVMRQSSNFAGERFNAGSFAMNPTHPSGFPHLQSQTSLQSRGFASSGFGISPQGMQVQGVQPQGTPFIPQNGLLPTTDESRLHALEEDSEGITSKKRENIDLWRQSIMQ